MLAASGASVLGYAPECAKTATAAREELTGQVATLALAEEYQAALDQAPDERLDEPVSLDDPCMIMYTSGTTGKPKGVVLTHRNVMAGGQNTVEAHALSAEDRALCVLPLYHINAEIVTVIAPLISGGSVVMPHRFSTRAFWGWLRDHHCTWFSVVPTIVAYLLEYGDTGETRVRDNPDFARLRFGRSASSALPAASHQAFEREFGIPLIDDRTMADLVLEGAPPPPIATYAPSAPVFTIGSLSKLVWPGLRVGWVRAPVPLIQRLARVKTAIDLASPLLTQVIGARVVGAIGDARRLRQRELKPRRDLLAKLLREQLPEWTFRVPEGGLFLWTRLPRGDAGQFAQVALRHGVVTLAGTTMSAAEEGVSFLRLPFFAEPATLRSAVDRLTAAWRDYRTHVRERRQPVHSERHVPD